MPKPKKTPDIIAAIKHPNLFGSLPAFQSFETWRAWLVWLKAVFALPMDENELAIYRQCTDRTEAPKSESSQIFTICGRRGGKSFVRALTAVYAASFGQYRRYLNAGERATVLVLARDKEQSKIVLGYIKGIIEAIPALRQTVIVERADEFELENGVTVAVKTSDYRSIRGLTIAFVFATRWRFGIQAACPRTKRFSLRYVLPWQPSRVQSY